MLNKPEGNLADLASSNKNQFSFSANNVFPGNSLFPVNADESEMRERHGGQYHLRHHLSGCAQTIYVIDFDKIFNIDEGFKSDKSTPATTSEVKRPTPEFSVTSPPTIIESHKSTLSDRVADSAIPFQNKQLIEKPVQESIKSIKNDNLHHHMTDEVREELVALSKLHTGSLHPMINSHGEVTQIEKNFGWQLNGNLAVNTNDKGQIELSSEMLQNNGVIFNSNLMVASDTQYHFEMNLLIIDHTEPPSFVLKMDDHEIALTSYKSPQGYVLKGDFVADHNGQLSLSLDTKGLISEGKTFWVDMPTLYPVKLQPELIELEIEPALNFSTISLIESDVISTPINALQPITTFLVEVEQDVPLQMFVENTSSHTTCPTEDIYSISDLNTEDWNSVVLYPTEPSLWLNTSNDSTDEIHLDINSSS